MVKNLQGGPMIKKVTEADFESEIIKSDRPVLVDMWAPWCGPCLAMDPALKELAEQFDGKVDVAKLNVDENPNVAQSFDVMSIPNMILFKDGKPVNRIIGLTSKDKVAAAMAAVV
jgi:thioredoxin 1